MRQIKWEDRWPRVKWVPYRGQSFLNRHVKVRYLGRFEKGACWFSADEIDRQSWQHNVVDGEVWGTWCWSDGGRRVDVVTDRGVQRRQLIWRIGCREAMLQVSCGTAILQGWLNRVRALLTGSNAEVSVRLDEIGLSRTRIAEKRSKWCRQQPSRWFDEWFSCWSGTASIGVR